MDAMERRADEHLGATSERRSSGDREDIMGARASIDDVVRDAIIRIMTRSAPIIADTFAATVAAELEGELRGVRRAGERLARDVAQAVQAGRARRDLTAWATDARARRVPKFVIEATGLDTKKKLVERYGADVVFEKGKPLPTPLER
jgi:hypothetical protein